MISMTGFGSSEYQDDQLQLSVEIKSYNNRYLDISFNAPSFLAVYESRMKERLRSEIERGHVDVNIKARRLESDTEVHIDSAALDAYRKAFSELIKLAQIKEPVGLSHYLQTEEVLKVVRRQDGSVFEQVLFEQLDAALEEFLQVRRREGARTAADIAGQLQAFTRQFEYVRGRADEIESLLYDNLTSRFKALLENEYDRTRVLQEVAVLLNKYTINEEIKRLESHIEHFTGDMASEKAVGKRLDFLCQELNREVNTIASKSIIVEVNQAVVAMKDHLENIREQLRNIE